MTLAALYKMAGAYAEAEPLYRQALAIREKIFGTKHPDTATSLNNLATLYNSMAARPSQERLPESHPFARVPSTFENAATIASHCVLASRWTCTFESEGGFMRSVSRVSFLLLESTTVTQARP